MSRTLTEIYTEAVTARNNYMQLTSLQPTKLSNSKLSILNLMTYIMSLMVYTYETVLDTFQIDILKIVRERMVGTADYYVRMAKLFQFDSSTSQGDEFTFNEDSLQMEYETVDETHQIIKYAAYEYVNDDMAYDMILKVCKADSDGTGNGTFCPLTDDELTAFKNYIDAIKFVGTDIKCESCYGDVLRLDAIIYYDDLYITAEQAFGSVQSALTEYAKELEYNTYVYYQAIIDKIQSIEHIKYVDGSTKIYVKSYDNSLSSYGDETEITDIYMPVSGYLVLNEDGVSTLTYSFCDTKANALIATGNLKFVPQSSL